MRYSTHKLTIEAMCRSFKSEAGLAGPAKDCLKPLLAMMAKNRAVQQSVIPVAFIDEGLYEWDGGKVVFVETPELGAILCRARYSLGAKPLRLPHRAFSVAVPEGFEVKGVAVPPFLVVDQCDPRRAKVCSELFPGVEYVPGPNPRPGFSILITGPDKAASRVTLPLEDLSKALDADDIMSVVGSYPGEHVQQLTMAERHVQGLCVKLLSGLCAYAEARPDLVVPGAPPGHKSRDLEDRAFIKGQRAFYVAQEPQGFKTRGGGGSKATHYRSCHFRAFPVKRDGTRKDGLVFVEGAVINAEAATVEEGV